ncbi:hypothetical protein EDD16DRAFT_1704842 [Pisolithus croceorrhizus]|nr:hypothetical protein EDD16DRAFT_1704842 [Pisolithus croceorrhizus]KAI6168957.1 hypothetical protein EDD17DRAFT_1749388 [Pisolithus thermaeus]
MPRENPIYHRKEGSKEHGDTVYVDSETSPHESLTLRRELLGKEQIHLVEHSGTSLDAVGEASSSNFTPETVYDTVQLLLGTPLPTHSDVQTVHTTSGTFQEPSEALPTGGDTQTTQMTNIAGDSVISPEELHFSNSSINPDDTFDGSTFVVGRLSDAVLDMIQEGLDHITAYLTVLATHILDNPLSRFLITSSSNPDSIPQMTGIECKLEPLWKSGSFTGSIESTPSATIHKKCYEPFKKDYHDTWQDILIKFKESMRYTETRKTVAQQQQLFNKSTKQFTQSLIALSKAHGIKMAFAMAGSIVNQDASLRYAYTVPGTEDFFIEHCHAVTDVIISHFKAHIYNQSSLVWVSEAFHVNKKGKAKEHNDTGCNVVDLTSDNDDLVQDNGSDE